MMRLSVVVLSFIMCAAPTLAQMVGPAPPGAAPQICRWITPNKNSAQQERVCKTAAEWQKYERDNDEAERRQAKEKEREKK